MRLDDYPFLLYWKPLALTIILLVVFGQTVFFNFVNWDDPHYLVNNPAIQNLSWGHVKQILTPGAIPEEQLYIPVTYLSHLAESALFGFSAGVVHGVNLLLHLLNVLLLYQLFKRWSNESWIAFAGAVLFAVHPLQAEAVAWAMGRKELLSTTFGLICLLGWQGFLEEHRRNSLLVAISAAALAMLCKPTMIMLPVLLLLVAWAVHEERLSRRELLAALPLIVLAATVLGLNRLIAAPTMASEASTPLALIQAAYLPALFNGWLERLLLLAPPMPHYRLGALSPSSISWLHALPLLILLGGLAIAFRHGQRRLWFGLCFAILAALPAIGILVLRNRYFVTADRYGYFPLIGVWFTAAIVLGQLAPTWRRAYTGLLVIFTCLAVVQTYRVTGIWRESRSLWEYVLRREPEHPIAHNALANALAEAGEHNLARHHYRTAALLQTDYPQPRYNLAMILIDSDPRQARRLLRHALIADPAFATAWHQLGTLHRNAGEPKAALNAYSRALIANPGLATAWFDRAQLHQDSGDLEAACRDLAQALRRRPDWSRAHFKLAVCHHRLSQPADAMLHYQRAIALDPTYHEAWYNMALLLQGLGQTQPARHALGQALALSPEDPDYLAAWRDMTER